MSFITDFRPSQSLHWQCALDTDGIVEGVADVQQAIRIILTTPLGSVPHRPLFGCAVLDLLDRDIDSAAPLFVQRATDAILEHEPRIQKVRITFDKAANDGSFVGAHFQIQWWPIDGVLPESMKHVIKGAA